MTLETLVESAFDDLNDWLMGKDDLAGIDREIFEITEAVVTMSDKRLMQLATDNISALVLPKPQCYAYGDMPLTVISDNLWAYIHDRLWRRAARWEKE